MAWFDGRADLWKGGVSPSWMWPSGAVPWPRIGTWTPVLPGGRCGHGMGSPLCGGPGAWIGPGWSSNRPTAPRCDEAPRSPSPSFQAPVAGEAGRREDLPHLGEPTQPVLPAVAVREVDQDRLLDPQPVLGGPFVAVQAGDVPVRGD